MTGCITWATAAPQSTMIHSPFSSPSMRGLSKPASRTASRTLDASALVCRLEVPLAMITRSNKGERCSVLKTTMSWPLTSSSPSTMARWSFWMSFLAVVSLVMKALDKGDGAKYSLRRLRAPEPPASCCGLRAGPHGPALGGADVLERHFKAPERQVHRGKVRLKRMLAQGIGADLGGPVRHGKGSQLQH